MDDLLIRHVRALRLDTGAPPAIDTDQAISIAGDRIRAIGPDADCDPTGARAVLDARGQLAIPGLINTHAHAPMVLFRGLAEDVSIDKWFNEYMWPLESNLIEEDVYWGMQLALLEMIEAGVTTVADHYFYMDRVAEAVAMAGTRAVLGWAVFGSNGYEALDATAAFVERWQGAAEGRITTWMAPHSPYLCDDDFLKAAVDHARRLGTGIHIHASEEMGQTQSSLEKRGITPIQVLAETGVLELPTIIAHGCGILPEDIPLLRQAAQVGVAHAPKTYLKLGMGLTPLRALRQAGIPVGLATDGPVSNNTLDIMESLRLMAMMQKHEARDPEVLTIPEALDIAFAGGAAVIGMSDRLGKLEPGYLADIVLIDMDGAHCQPGYSTTANLVYSARAADVQTVIVNGKPVMRDREHLTLDKTTIVANVRQSMARLAERVPARRIQVYNP